MFSRSFLSLGIILNKSPPSITRSSAALSSLLQLQPQIHQQRTQRRRAPMFAEAEDINTEEESSATAISSDDALLTTQQHHQPQPYYASQNQKSLRSDLAKMQREVETLHREQQLAPSSSSNNNDDDDDFFVIENPFAPNRQEKIIDASKLKKDMSGNINHVPKDSITFVADEFKRLRDLEAIRRRKILAELASPNPLDYSYGGKLVPVPPLNFGKFAPQSFDLAEKMLMNPTFRKVKEAPATDYFFEINDLYCEISFVGRANAGKSSLINAILGQKELARTSSVPHSTRNITFYQSVSDAEFQKFARKNPNKLVKLPGGGLQFTLVDVPGFGLDGMSSKWRDNAIALTDSYFGQRRSVNTVFMCVDAKIGVTPTDVTYFEWMTNVHGVFYIILTKCDSVPHTRLCTVMNHIYTLITEHQKCDKYRKIYPFVLPVSAETGENIDLLRALIVETSGVLPADTLRKLLQQRNGSKWFEAVREEEKRLLDEESSRKQALLQTRQQLLSASGYMIDDANIDENTGNEQDSEIVGSQFGGQQRRFEDDFGLYGGSGENTEFGENSRNLHLGENNNDNNDNGKNKSDDVMSFDVPETVDLMKYDDHKTDSDDVYLKKIGQFRLRDRKNPNVSVFKESHQQQNQQHHQSKSSNSPINNNNSDFASELAQKMSAMSSSGGGHDRFTNNYQQQQQQPPYSSSSSSVPKKKKNRRPQLIVEKDDGSLLDQDRYLQEQKPKSVSELRYERRNQARLKMMQESEIWSRHQQEEENNNNNSTNGGSNSVAATASAMRELKELREQHQLQEGNNSSSTSLDTIGQKRKHNHRSSNNNNNSKHKLLSKMSKREREAYMRNCGGTLLTGESLVEHTHQQMAVGEQRVAKTMRKKGELEYNHSGRLQLKSQPGGLFRAYGSANPGNVNSSSQGVKGSNHEKDRRVIGW